MSEALPKNEVKTKNIELPIIGDVEILKTYVQHQIDEQLDSLAVYEDEDSLDKIRRALGDALVGNLTDGEANRASTREGIISRRLNKSWNEKQAVYRKELAVQRAQYMVDVYDEESEAGRENVAVLLDILGALEDGADKVRVPTTKRAFRVVEKLNAAIIDDQTQLYDALARGSVIGAHIVEQSPLARTIYQKGEATDSLVVGIDTTLAKKIQDENLRKNIAATRAKMGLPPIDYPE